MMMNNSLLSSYFILSSSCAMTKGYRRTLIQDFIRNYADFVSNDYYELSMLLDRHKVCEIMEMVDEKSHAHFFEFLDFMLKKEYSFLTEDISLFPPISTKLDDSSQQITDAIIEIDEEHSDMVTVKVISINSQIRVEAIPLDLLLAESRPHQRTTARDSVRLSTH